MPDAPYKLILLRHAEAVTGGFSDISRPLSPRGLLEAGYAGSWLAQGKHALDQIICSNSLRTQQTLDQVMRALHTVHVHYEEKVYLAHHGRDLVSTLSHGIDSKSKTVLLVGHNPAISSFADILAGGPISFSPSDCYVFQLKAESWDEALHSDGLWTVTGSFLRSSVQA